MLLFGNAQFGSLAGDGWQSLGGSRETVEMISQNVEVWFLILWPLCPRAVLSTKPRTAFQ